MARFGFHDGVVFNGSATILAGAGAVRAVTATDTFGLVLGWACVVLGVGLFVWGFKIDGKRWWERWIPISKVAAIPETALTVEPGRLILTNLGDGAIWLAGLQFEGAEADLSGAPREIQKGHHYYLLTEKLIQWSFANLGADGERFVRLDFYLLDQKKSGKYKAKCALLIKVENGSVTFNPQNLGTEKADW